MRLSSLPFSFKPEPDYVFLFIVLTFTEQLRLEGISREVKPLTEVVGTRIFLNAEANNFLLWGAMYKPFFYIYL